MIDIHSHILPGLDDDSGFKTLIATPHVLEGRDFLSSTEILATTDQVRERVAEAGILSPHRSSVFRAPSPGANPGSCSS